MKIDKYSFGSITIDGHEYRTDLIIYPDRIDDKWWRKEGHLLQLEDLSGVLELKPRRLIVGQGQPGLMRVDPKVEDHCRLGGIALVVLPTEQAVQEYNRTENKEKIVAALHLTC